MEDLELKEKEVNSIINKIFNNHYDEDKLIFNNLSTLRNLFLLVDNNLYDLFDNNRGREIDWFKVSHADFMKKISIIKNFYKYLAIDYDVDIPINDGTFIINTNSIEEAVDNQRLLTYGNCSNSINDPKIRVQNNDLITDAIVWVHELSHYRNNKLEQEPQVRRILTESLAFAYEYIFIDYLEKIGYVYESKKFKFDETINLFRHSYYSYYLMQVLIIYDMFGVINKENYLKLFNNDDYEKMIKEFYSIIKDRFIAEMIQYSIASALSIYMYEEYKKDKCFIKKIEKLNEAVNNKSSKECLSIIGLINYNENGFCDKQNKNKIVNAIIELNNELEEDLKKDSNYKEKKKMKL